MGPAVFDPTLPFDFEQNNCNGPYLDKSIMSRIVTKPDFCLCKNKDADQLLSNCEADQRLCFRYSDSTIPFLLIAKISSL